MEISEIISVLAVIALGILSIVLVTKKNCKVCKDDGKNSKYFSNMAGVGDGQCVMTAGDNPFGGPCCPQDQDTYLPLNAYQGPGGSYCIPNSKDPSGACNTYCTKNVCQGQPASCIPPCVAQCKSDAVTSCQMFCNEACQSGDEGDEDPTCVSNCISQNC